MSHRSLLRTGVVAAAFLLAMGTLGTSDVGATGPSAGPRIAADAQPTPTAATGPTGCPEPAVGDVPLATIIATGPAKMVECQKAQDGIVVWFDAYFPAQACDGCGGTGGATIGPAWLSGGVVDYDAASRAVTAAPLSGARGMRVTTQLPPDGVSPAELAAWMETHALDLRLPPGMGSCAVDDTSTGSCSLAHYADTMLSISGHYMDDAAETCTGIVADGSAMDPPAVFAYCDQQLVVDSFTVISPAVCPAAPYTVVELSHYSTDRLLACLGSRKIVVTGYVRADVGFGRGSVWSGTPGWLSADWGPGQILFGWPSGYAPFFELRVPPALGTCDVGQWDMTRCPFGPFVGRWVRFVGRYEDPRSATCRASWSPLSGQAPAWFTRAFVRQQCRERFVITSRPVGVEAPAAP
jgi:hypothetical protein